MKVLKSSFCLALTAALLVGCNPPDSGGGAAKYLLTVTLSGVSAAPVKITDATSGTVLFSDLLTGSKTFSDLTAKSILKIEGQAVNGYSTPAAQTVALDANKTVTLEYKAVQTPGGVVVGNRMTGTLAPWPFKGGKLGIELIEAGTVVAASPMEISGTGSFDAALPTPTQVSAFIGSCTFAGSTNVPDFNTEFGFAGAYSPAGDFLGDVIEHDPNGAFVVRQYVDRNVVMKGAVACGNGGTATVDLNLTQGWNAVTIATDPVTRADVFRSVPAGTRTSFAFVQAEAQVNIQFDDASELKFKAGEQAQRTAMLWQTGGFSGTVSFETDVPGLVVTPGAVQLNPLSVRRSGGPMSMRALDLQPQALKTALTFDASGVKDPFSGSLTVYAVQNGVRVGQGTLPSVSIQVPYVMPWNVPTQAVQVAQGETGSLTFDLLSQGGFSGSTSVTLSNLPVGVSASTETVTLTNEGRAQVTLQITVAPDAPTGMFEAKLTGPNVKTYQGGVTAVGINVTPARTLLAKAVTAVIPATQGVWTLAPGTGSATLQQIEGSQVVSTHELTGNTELRMAPGGEAITISQTMENYRSVYTVKRFGWAGELSSITAPDQFDGQNYSRGAMGTGGHLWFMRDTAVRTGGGTSAALTKVNLTDGTTTEVTGSQFTGHETLYASPDGATIVIPSALTAGSFTRVNTATGVTATLRLSQSTYYEGLLVLNSGELLLGGSSLHLVDLNGNVTTFNTPDGTGVKFVGLDRVRPVLWLESGSSLFTFDLTAWTFTRITPLPSTSAVSYQFGGVTGAGGVGLVSTERYLSNGNYASQYFISFVK